MTERPQLICLPSGDTQCPACGLLNPDVPEGGNRCEVCEQFVMDIVEPHLSERIAQGTGAVNGQRGNHLALSKTPASVTGHRFSFFEKLNIGPAENVYLRRWYIISTPWFGLYLHHILRPDADLDCHNHPWAFTNVILRGGYIEERTRVGETGKRVGVLKPGSIHRFPLEDFHRIARLLDPKRGVWSICFIGRRRRVWSFLTPDGEVPWNEYESVA